METRINDFLGELAKNNVRAYSIARSTYRINDIKVSIRTTTKLNPYWYDISKNVMSDVEYLIYQTDSRYHFVLFPSSFFRTRYEMLQDSNRQHAKIFYIDWPNKTFISKPHFIEKIREYCCSTLPEKNYGNWKDVFHLT